MITFITQTGDYLIKEKNALLICQGCCAKVSYENLSTFSSKNYVPVGTVEYVEKYCRLNGIKLPDNISYPPALKKYLKRNIVKSTFEEAPDNYFVKPQKTKLFTGGIKNQIPEKVDGSTPVWVSEPIDFIAEYRYYINRGKVVGHSRYDGNDDCDIEPSFEYVMQIVHDYINSPIAYAIDIGITSDRESMLIEVNDGWSLGLYPWGTMTDFAYVELITNRWKQIAKI